MTQQIDLTTVFHGLDSAACCVHTKRQISSWMCEVAEEREFNGQIAADYAVNDAAESRISCDQESAESARGHKNQAQKKWKKLFQMGKNEIRMNHYHAYL